MTPAQLDDWEVTAGDDFAVTVVVEGFGVTGRTWRSQLRRRPSAELSAEFTITATDGTGVEAGNAILNVALPAAVTQTLHGRYVFDLQQVDGSGTVTLFKGALVVRPQVTR